MNTTFDKFLIAPFQDGLRNDLPSWVIPEKAFTRLNNAYVSRGRVKKRFGSVLTGQNTGIASDNLYSRLRIKLGTTVGGALSGTVPGSIFDIGQMFSIDDTIYTINVAGTPADMLKTDGTTTATFNIANGAYVFAGAPDNKDIYFYPSSPVMGFTYYEKGPVNEHTAFAFDRQFVYKYNGTDWQQDGTTVWHGDDTNFFWSENHSNPVDSSINLFTTNFNVTTTGTPAVTDDPIYFYNGTTWANFSTYTKFYHDAVAVDEDYISSARLILSFAGRLLLLNVVEHDTSANTNTHFPFRLRYSAIGNVFSPDAWLEKGQKYGTNTYAGGGYIDAPTSQEIMSLALLKGRVVVYC